MISIILLVLFVLLGSVTGLMPGIHSNTVISVLVSLGVDPSLLPYIILAVFGAHLVFSFVPSIFFSVPDPSSAVSVLPGQRMVLEGEGLSALKVIIFSILLSALVSVAVFQPSLSLLPIIYGAIRPYIPYILVALSVILLLRSKSPPASALVFLAAGILGFLTLRTDMADPFLPLFSGMFAVPAILLYKKGLIPKQKENEIDFSFLPYVFIGVAGGFFADLLPGISSPSQVASFFSLAFAYAPVQYLSVIASITTSQAIFSLATFSSIGKARSGAVAMLADSVGKDAFDPSLYLPVLFGALLIACLLLFSIRKRVVGIAKLDMGIISKALLAYLAVLVLILDGPLGLLVFAVSAVLGYLTVMRNVERTSMMGSIIVPTIILLF
ncbi:MAG: tripartite tricarboxylate transporter permease [Candidatus Bilamarchaeaceae archaeon]